MKEIILPDLGEGIDKATIVCWHVKVGEQVDEGQDVCEVVTDKATFHIESPIKGRVQDILVNEGADARVGTSLGVIA